MKADKKSCWVFFFIFMWFGFPRIQGESKAVKSDMINLPSAIEGWKLEGHPQRIEKSGIFDYMDGAGELYLGYHFGHIMVYQYLDKSDNEILVELYEMKDSRDAFGLLSLDWGGEAVTLGRTEEKAARNSIVPSARALYGMGLLRLWSDNLYARIMATKETPEAKAVILKLGKLIIAGRTQSGVPGWLKVINPVEQAGWTLKKESTAYFYSHLVLNSLYYLSHKNILNLNRDTEAIMTVYEKDRAGKEKQRIHLLVIGYPDSRQAGAALEGFVRDYVPELNQTLKPLVNGETLGFSQVEDGWLGCRLCNRNLALVFGGPDLESARLILNLADLKSF
jgi:hypothetical protein